MSEDVKAKQSSGNVFKDVGFSDTEAERALLKADLAIEIHNIIEPQHRDPDYTRRRPRGTPASRCRLGAFTTSEIW